MSSPGPGDIQRSVDRLRRSVRSAKGVLEKVERGLCKSPLVGATRQLRPVTRQISYCPTNRISRRGYGRSSDENPTNKRPASNLLDQSKGLAGINVATHPWMRETAKEKSFSGVPPELLGISLDESICGTARLITVDTKTAGVQIGVVLEVAELSTQTDEVPQQSISIGDKSKSRLSTMAKNESDGSTAETPTLGTGAYKKKETMDILMNCMKTTDNYSKNFIKGIMQVLEDTDVYLFQQLDYGQTQDQLDISITRESIETTSTTTQEMQTEPTRGHEVEIQTDISMSGESIETTSATTQEMQTEPNRGHEVEIQMDISKIRESIETTSKSSATMTANDQVQMPRNMHRARVFYRSTTATLREDYSISQHRLRWAGPSRARQPHQSRGMTKEEEAGFPTDFEDDQFKLLTMKRTGIGISQPRLRWNGTGRARQPYQSRIGAQDEKKRKYDEPEEGVQSQPREVEEAQPQYRQWGTMGCIGQSQQMPQQPVPPVPYDTGQDHS